MQRVSNGRIGEEIAQRPAKPPPHICCGTLCPPLATRSRIRIKASSDWDPQVKHV